jgi:hypothetical protein
MNGVVIATQRTDNPTWTTARPYTLTVGGVDLDISKILPATSWSIPLESISIEEEGFGGSVSGMDFDIYDPGRVVSIADSAEVIFHDNTNNRHLFRGFVGFAKPVTEAAGQRTIKVSCVGLEAVLDWRVIPSDTTFAAGSYAVDGIQTLVAVATGVGVPLRSGSGFDTGGNQDETVGMFGLTDLGVRFPRPLEVAVTVAAGSTLRQGIETLCAATRTYRLDTSFLSPVVSVDFAGGIRVFDRRDPPTDYGTLTIGEALGTQAATRVELESDAISVPHQAYIKGGNAAGSGPVTDGTGIPGPTIFLQDDTITTAAQKQALGESTLDQTNLSDRLTVELEGYVPTADVHTGWNVAVTNTSLGLAGDTFLIYAITKRFVTGSGRQDWTITAGRPRKNTIGSVATKYRQRS